MASDIVRFVDDQGIEYYTVTATGEAGMSLRGLARFCGVHHSSVQKFVGGLDDAILDTARVSTATGRTATVKIVRDTICADTIVYYATQGKPEAVKALVGFAAIGIRSFIHSQTGWTVRAQSAKVMLSGLMLREPAPWERLCSNGFIGEACRLTGHQWNWKVMGKFLKKHIYDRCGSDVQVYLNEVNPADENGNRPNKNHQHFQPEARAMLQQHVKTVEDLMRVSVNAQMFEKLMGARFDGCNQMTVFDI